MISIEEIERAIKFDLYISVMYCKFKFSNIKLKDINGVHVNHLGIKRWYKNGKYHREDGPAVEYWDGEKNWYKNGKLHREDGPAIERNGNKHWWINGKRHRIDGPAIEWANVSKSWWLNDIRYSQKDWQRVKEKEK